jgi:hypothetical protein
VYVQMPDPGRYVERARPEHWHDMHVLHTILDPDDAMRPSCGKRRGVHYQFGWGLALDGNDGEAPRTSFVLWAKAFMASGTPPAAASQKEPSHRHDAILESHTHRETLLNCAPSQAR